jgi:adenylate cyclase
MTEIERKFLVKTEIFPGSSKRTVIKQGYLSVDPDRVVRIRIEGDKAWLTIKGKGSGFSRPEFEYPIPVTDAEELMALCLYPPVEKVRHRLDVEGTLWEVDEFLGSNRGLVMAEVELEREDQPFVMPDWAGEEVTGDKRYYNAWLAGHPFTEWPGKD